jgi:glycine betaine/choline ABC-type transport system substrate-binding protein
MREADVTGIRMSKMSELATYIRKHQALVLCAPEELNSAITGLRGLQQVYQVDFLPQQVRTMPFEEGLAALQLGECSCALAYSLDVADNHELRFLEDDKQFLPVAGYAMAIRQDFISEYPDILPILDRVNGWLTPANVALLMQQVDKGLQLDDIAQQFVKAQSR